LWKHCRVALNAEKNTFLTCTNHLPCITHTNDWPPISCSITVLDQVAFCRQRSYFPALRGFFVYEYWWMQYSHLVEHSCVLCSNENGCWNVVTISCFQDPNQLIRASALRVLSSIRVPMIVPIVMLAIKDSASDMSPYVRKTAAHAIPKLYRYSAFL